MFILDAPYVSDYLKQTVADSRRPVLDTNVCRGFLDGVDCTLCTPDEFARLCKETGDCRVYSNSENAIDWIAAHLRGTELPKTIENFKDKARFRELLRALHPDFFFQEVALDSLDTVDVTQLPTPFIIKPAVGFFSLGVHRVDSNADWPPVKDAIRREAAEFHRQYPAQVLHADRFIIEACIPGEEFAVDVYWDENGDPVVLNILAHLFASAKDVSDRVYYTSPTIIERWLQPFTEYLAKMGKRAGLRNFPAHVELRTDEEGNIAPIEANPLRFAGWCVADMAQHAYGFNPYLYYLENKRPDWESILPPRRGKVFALVVADIAGHIDRSNIANIDYDAFTARFSKVLELRPVDWKKYSAFAFLFAEGREDNLEEFKAILGSDLTEFMVMV